jgi:hypothetical protein
MCRKTNRGTETNTAISAFLQTITKYNSGDQTERTEVGRACSKYGERRGAYRVLARNLRDGDHF